MARVSNQVCTYLKPKLAASPDAAGRAFVRRTYPLAREARPAYLVSVDVERSEDVAMGGTQERIATVRIVAIAKGDQEDDEALLDRMAVFAEGVFSADPTLGGLAVDYVYRSTEFSTGSIGEKTVSVAALSFDVTIITRRADPETPLI